MSTTVDGESREASTLPRVLSIQSHVVSGYVGNKAATFPMQVLGFDVDCINSVNFSNHTAYPIIKGTKMNGDQLWELFEGLRGNELHMGYTHVLTGYIGEVSMLRMIVKVLEILKRECSGSGLLYVCDPVMGDDGKLYVSKDLVSVYKDEVIQHADIIVPNMFEAELLTGIEITSQDRALQAIGALHEKGIPTVIITSATHVRKDEDVAGDEILVYGSQVVSGGGHPVQFRIRVPKLDIEGSFTGTGDLFAGLILCWSYRHGLNLGLAVRKTLSTVYKVLEKTFNAMLLSNSSESSKRKRRESLRWKSRELLLIQSKNEIENPDVDYFEVESIVV
eukprot:Nk52_evm76s352 gene=Nk52_evmTU76s352